MNKKKLKPEEMPLDAAKKSVIRLKKRVLKRGQGDDLLVADLCDQALRLHELISFDEGGKRYDLRRDDSFHVRRKVLKM